MGHSEAPEGLHRIKRLYLVPDETATIEPVGTIKVSGAVIHISNGTRFIQSDE